jgi:hypothetical protein
MPRPPRTIAPTAAAVAEREGGVTGRRILPGVAGRHARRALALLAMALAACGSVDAPGSHFAGRQPQPRHHPAADTARHAAALTAPATGRTVVFRSSAAIPSGADLHVIVRQDGRKLTERRFAVCARGYENTHVRAVMGACPRTATAAARLVLAVQSLDHRAHRVTITYQVDAPG